uniref:Protein kinase domain-containing protein n=1 Tax=Salix viminalis TaxID=40686 RepID=A0A6N2LJH0_SALVM
MVMKDADDKSKYFGFVNLENAEDVAEVVETLNGKKVDDLKGLDLKTGSLTLKQIKVATNNFDPANKIGEAGFGLVYKGHGTIIAVKQLSSKSKQGNREFVNEIGMISSLQHPHLSFTDVALKAINYCWCTSPEEYRLNLDWATRQKICVGIARGLAYLHEESRLKIVHRDIKATNPDLMKRTAPTGYMAPEYAMRGYLTDKSCLCSSQACDVCSSVEEQVTAAELNEIHEDNAALITTKLKSEDVEDPRPDTTRSVTPDTPHTTQDQHHPLSSAPVTASAAPDHVRTESASSVFPELHTDSHDHPQPVSHNNHSMSISEARVRGSSPSDLRLAVFVLTSRLL